MLKRLCVLFLVSVVIASLSGCNSTIKASLDTEFTLSIGQSAIISNESIEIEFADITGDSRCPSDVTCIWAGEVSCEVNISQSGEQNRIILTQPGLTDTSSEYIYQGYAIDFKVSPYPESGTTIEKGDYRLTLIISKLTD